MIGKSVPRVDAYEKVTGRAKFTEDLLPKRCLVAKVLHATIGNGIVKSIDTSEAESMEGVVKVVTFHDVPDHCYPTPGHPWSVELAHQDVADRNLLTGRVRYYGDDIAAVVAEDEIIASRAFIRVNPCMEANRRFISIKKITYLPVQIILSEMSIKVWKKPKRW